MVEIKAKISKVGNSYVFFIPKALVDCGVLPIGKKVTFKLEDKSLQGNPALLRCFSFRLDSLHECSFEVPEEVPA